MKSDDEVELIVETPFVGRTACLNILDKAWDKHRIIGVYGLRAVGKSRTVREFFKKKVHLTDVDDDTLNAFKEVKDIVVDMRCMRDSASLHMNLCASLKIEPIDEVGETRYKHKWKRQIRETISSQNDCLHLLLFDNADDILDGILKDEFLELVSSYLVTLKNVKQFITSTIKVMPLARIQRTYFTHELGPMVEYEASELLDKVAPNVVFGEYKDAIVRLSEGWF